MITINRMGLWGALRAIGGIALVGVIVGCGGGGTASDPATPTESAKWITESQACTPGYWRNHADSWGATGYSWGDDFDSVFGVDYFDPDITLGDAIWMGGGGVKKLARHGTAALLSAAHPDVNYPYTVAEVIASVQAGDADALAMVNDLYSCPLN